MAKQSTLEQVLRRWNNFTTGLIVLCCAVVWLRKCPLELWATTHSEALHQGTFSVGFHIAATVAVVHVSLVLLYGYAQMQRGSAAIAFNGFEDSCIMSVVHAVLMATFWVLAYQAESFVHTDHLAYGGPRPVYSLRYLAWVIDVPLLMAAAGGYEKPEKKSQMSSLLPSNSDQSPPAEPSLPWAPFAYVTEMRLAASARLTSAYITASWVALVTDDPATRWTLITLSFSAFVIASLEQAYVVYTMGNHPTMKLRKILLILQASLFSFYGLNYLLGCFSLISPDKEQTMYTLYDIFAKVFHSVLLLGARHLEDLQDMMELWDGAQTVASDLWDLIENAQAPIFGVGPNCVIVVWNREISELTGVTAEQALGKKLEDLISYRGKDWVTEVVKELQKGQKFAPEELRFARREAGGSPLEEEEAIIMVSPTLQRSAFGEVARIVFIGQDVTQAKLREREAKRMAQDLARFLDSANAPIFGVDLDYRINEWNSWLAKMSGKTKAEVLGREVVSLAAGKSKKILMDALKQASAGTDSNELFELSLPNANTDVVAHLLLQATPRLGQKGEVEGAYCVGQDITHMKELDERKAAIMAMVSHELKSPLHGLIGLSHSLISQKSALNQEAHTSLQMIHRCGVRLLDLVTDIMDTSALMKDKKLPLCRDSVQLAAIVDEVVTLCRHSVDKQGSPTMKPEVMLINKVRHLPVIEADSYRCVQLIFNLVTNALKFTLSGTVTISASADDAQQLVTIAIADTGIGIAPENLERIFQPFDQEDFSEGRAYEGLGLGLAMSKEIVERHGGALTVESAVGKGSTFTVTLPYKMKSSAAGAAVARVPPEPFAPPHAQGSPLWRKGIEPTAAPAPLSLTSLHKFLPGESPNRSLDLLPPANEKPVVLYVDGDAASQEIVKSLLASCNFKKKEATTGQAALKFLNRKTPGIVLLDLMLPDQSGLEVLEIIRKDFGQELLPVCMVSAQFDGDSVAKALDLGCNDFVKKPFNGAELISRIKLQLGLSALRSSGMKATHPAAVVSKSFLPRLEDCLFQDLAPAMEPQDSWRTMPRSGSRLSLQGLSTDDLVIDRRLLTQVLPDEAIEELLRIQAEGPSKWMEVSTRPHFAKERTSDAAALTDAQRKIEELEQQVQSAQQTRAGLEQLLEALLLSSRGSGVKPVSPVDSAMLGAAPSPYGDCTFVPGLPGVGLPGFAGKNKDESSDPQRLGSVQSLGIPGGLGLPSLTGGPLGPTSRLFPPGPPESAYGGPPPIQAPHAVEWSLAVVEHRGMELAQRLSPPLQQELRAVLQALKQKLLQLVLNLSQKEQQLFDAEHRLQLQGASIQMLQRRLGQAMQAFRLGRAQQVFHK